MAQTATQSAGPGRTRRRSGSTLPASTPNAGATSHYDAVLPGAHVVDLCPCPAGCAPHRRAPRRHNRRLRHYRRSRGRRACSAWRGGQSMPTARRRRRRMLHGASSCAACAPKPHGPWHGSTQPEAGAPCTQRAGHDRITRETEMAAPITFDKCRRRPQGHGPPPRDTCAPDDDAQVAVKLCGIQAQEAPAAALVVCLRSHGLTSADVPDPGRFLGMAATGPVAAPRS